MSIEPNQLRNLIDQTLKVIIPTTWSIEARELLMMTAAQESHCGRYLQQVGCGIALGLFQMEPATYKDCYQNFLVYHKNLRGLVEENFLVHEDNFKVNLMGNIPYQIVMARLQYYRFSEAIPSTPQHSVFNSDFIHALACYYKKYWNTKKGKATVGEALRNYDKYAS